MYMFLGTCFDHQRPEDGSWPRITPSGTFLIAKSVRCSCDVCNYYLEVVPMTLRSRAGWRALGSCIRKCLRLSEFVGTGMTFLLNVCDRNRNRKRNRNVIRRNRNRNDIQCLYAACGRAMSPKSCPLDGKGRSAARDNYSWFPFGKRWHKNT